MKKLALIVVICFVTALFISSCSSKSCPAYAKVRTEQTGHNS